MILPVYLQGWQVYRDGTSFNPHKFISKDSRKSTEIVLALVRMVNPNKDQMPPNLLTTPGTA